MQVGSALMDPQP